MFGIKTLVAIRSLETDLKALQRRFETLEQYVDDRLKLVRNAENRIKHKERIMEEEDGQQAAADGETIPGVDIGRGLTPRERTITQMIMQRRAGRS